MKTNRKHYGLRVLVLALMVAVLLLGSIGMTGAAAQSAIPGDALYPVKTTIEQTRLTLAKDAGDRAVLKMGFAAQRLEEIRALIQEGRFVEVRQAVLAFEANINGAILEVETVAKADPTRAARLTMEIISALTRYAQVLSDLAAIAPDSVRLEVTRALDSAQVASSLDLPGSNDNSNDNGNDNSNSNDNANDDNSNGNANDDNSNDDNGNANDDNSNDDNGNANDDNSNDDNSNDDNSNGNANDDDSNDDNSNGNSNDNADDNSNDNADDNSNDNADDNSNDNADDNSNDNGDDDSNDNADDNSNDNADDNSNDNGDDDSNDNKSGDD